MPPSSAGRARCCSKTRVAGQFPGIAPPRALGMIGAADLAWNSQYPSKAGCCIYEAARKRGACSGPLGDTVYVCPPLNIGDDELETLLGILEESVRAVSAG